MQQHPIPQHVTGYKFHLVGDMTLKQFIQLATGIVLAWVIFSSNLNFLFKWTLGPISAFLGFALAFIPIEDRPLDQWIINFFKSIYSPTQYHFKAEPKELNIFSASQVRPQTTETQVSDPKKLDQYLQSLPSSTTAFDQAEERYLEHLNNLFGAVGKTTVKKIKEDLTPPTLTPDPVKGIKVRKLHHPQMCLLPHATTYQTHYDNRIAAMPNKTANNNDLANAKSTAKSLQSLPGEYRAPMPKKTTTNSLGANAIRQKPVKRIYPANARPKQPFTDTTYAKDIILPQLPEKPNLLAGITLDKQAKIIGNVILEIRDSQNRPVRALKSNKLGQFFISTPLSDGVYQLDAEHTDHRFAIMKLEAKGEVIPPIKLQAR